MAPLLVGYIGIAVLIIFLFSGIHIGVVMGFIGFLGIAYLINWGAAMGILQTVPYVTFAKYDFTVIPLFLLMGEFCFQGGISGDLYETAHKIFGKLRGGLAVSTVGACAAFGAVSGSGIATASTMATVALPEMKKYNYDPSLATGTLAVGGTLGILIPPSIPMVIYGMITEQSIGQLYVAGVIPGVMQTALFIGMILFLCWRNPLLGPPGPSSSLLEKVKSLKNVWIVVVLFLLVIGGMELGVFSPTEGAGIGAVGAFFFAVARRRLGWKQFKASVLEATKTSAMIFFIIVGAMILNAFLAVTRLPFELSAFVGSLPISRYIIWFLIVIMYVILGALMDEIGMLLLTVPILFPIITALGFDPIWFGIMIVIICEMGMICPPVGINVFVIKGMAQDVPTYTIYRGILPFLYVDLFQMLILTAFPAIVLWLPTVLRSV